MSLKNINPSPKFTRYLVASEIFVPKPLVVVDIGARGGFEQHWSVYGNQVRLIGFDADEKECEKLNQRALNSGSRFYPVALHQNKGRRIFYVTAHPSSSGFYQPDMNVLNRFPDKANLAVTGTCEIDTIDLDSFARQNGINYVDFIKLDTEGTELDILKGATGFLKKTITGLSIEFWFQPWHKAQPLFSDIESFLSQYGFRMFDMVTYRRSREALPELTPSLLDNVRRGQLVSGEALFLRDGAGEIEAPVCNESDWDDIKVLKLASIMELFCLSDCAIELLQTARQKGLLKDKDVDNLIDSLVPGKNSYTEYMRKLETIRTRGYAGKIEHGKRIARKVLPKAVRQGTGSFLTKTRESIDKAIK